MNEEDVRALVREAIERHLGRPGGVGMRGEGRGAINPGSRQSPIDNAPYASPFTAHPSHVFLTVLPGSDVGDGMCVIEPAVRCNHCGFCQSYGH